MLAALLHPLASQFPRVHNTRRHRWVQRLWGPPTAVPLSRGAVFPTGLPGASLRTLPRTGPLSWSELPGLGFHPAVLSWGSAAWGSPLLPGGRPLWPWPVTHYMQMEPPFPKPTDLQCFAFCLHWPHRSHPHCRLWLCYPPVGRGPGIHTSVPGHRFRWRGCLSLVIILSPTILHRRRQDPAMHGGTHL